jgi:hypothetical protein
LEAKGCGYGHGKEEEQNGGISSHFWILRSLMNDKLLAWLGVVGSLIYSQLRKHNTWIASHVSLRHVAQLR